MTRGLDAAEVTASQQPHRIVVPLIEAVFDSGPLRLAISPWPIEVGGNTFVAAGAAMKVRDMIESAGSTEGLTLELSGLDPAIIAIATQEPYQGRVLRLLKAFLHADTHQLVATPKAPFVGRMRSMSIVETNDLCTVTVTVEHYEAELRRPAPLRMNDADQQRLYPGDLGCQYAEQMTEKSIVWPAKEALQR